LIGLDNYSFLDLRYGVDRPSDNGIQLFLILRGGNQRLVQCAFDAKRAQLPFTDRAQSFEFRCRYEILRAGLHGFGDVRLPHNLSDNDERNRPSHLITNSGNIADGHRKVVGKEPQQLWVMGFDCVEQCIDGLHPVTVNRMPGLTEGAIDQFHVVFPRGYDNHRYY